MQLSLYQVDAFTETVFGGNPAAVVPLLEQPVPDEKLQRIAEENRREEQKEEQKMRVEEGREEEKRRVEENSRRE